MIEIGGNVNVPSEKWVSNDVDSQSVLASFGLVVQEGADAVANRELTAGRYRQHVGTSIVAIGNDDDVVRLVRRQPRQVSRQRQIAVRDHDTFVAFVGERRDAGSDRAVETVGRPPENGCVVLVGPLGNGGIVADDEGRERLACSDHACRHTASELLTGRWREVARQSAFGGAEILHRYEYCSAHAVSLSGAARNRLSRYHPGMQNHAVGTLALGAIAEVDGGGAVHFADGGAPIAWYVAADDRWHTPAVEATTRQHLVEGVPVIETVIRVPGGDAAQRVYAVPEQGGLVIMEFENRSSLPFAIAVDSPQVKTSRPPADVPIEGIDLPPGSVLVPIGKASTVRLAVGVAPGAMPAVPSSDDVVRGWLLALDRSPRLAIPDDKVVLAIRQARTQLVLGARPDDTDPIGFVLAVSELVRVGEAAEPWVDDVAAAAVRIGQASRRAREPFVEVALRRAAEVLRDAGQERAAADIERFPLPAASAAKTLVGQHAGDSADLGRLVAGLLDRYAQRSGSTVAVLTEPIDPSWFGAPIEVHGAPIGGGSVSYAIRWHGDRPAILWESSLPVTISAPGIDATWSASGSGGEALLAPPVMASPTESASFS